MKSIKIPRKPAWRFVFVSNIKDPLAGESNPHPELMEAFLLSATYSTAKTLRLAAAARANGSLIISDNGNFSRMQALAAGFEKKGRQLLAKALKETEKEGRVSKEVIQARQALFTEIREAVKTEQQRTDIPAIIKRQLKCSPDYLVGMEDLTIPVLQLCDLFHPVFLPDPAQVKPFQQSTRRIFLDEQEGEYGAGDVLRSILKFLVYHAYDYRSARQAALLNKKTGAGGIAISFGATLASKKYLSSVKIGRKTYKFSEVLPEPYLLSVALVAGARSNGRDDLPVHILGLGTPILIVLLSLLLRTSKAVSIDSTATFMDADDGNIYGGREAYLKMDMYKLAAGSLVNDDPYHSSSPWFGWFNSLYPADWKGLKKQLVVKPDDDITELARKLKGNPRLLEKYIPFFSPMRAGNDSFIKKVRIARTGANFWVLKSICGEVRKRKGSASALHAWVGSEVKRYGQVASPKWAAAVRACFEIIKEQVK